MERKWHISLVSSKRLDNMSMMNLDWFSSKKVRDGLYVIKEHHFFEGNRCNIYLIKGPSKDVVIDTGLGVSDLRYYLQGMNLIDGPGGERDCVVICTHNHFDHSGGAHHFDNVFIHEDDMIGLRRGQQTETLNYVKGMHFYQQPFRGFSAYSYKVPPTQCHPIQDGDKIDLGGGEHLEIMHFPGHTRGSIALYYPEKQELFSGDIVYECGDGGGLLDWLPNSNVQEYLRSANRLSDWLSQNQITMIYPGHFKPITPDRAIELLLEYTETKDNPCSQGCMTCLQHTTWWYFLFGCFRCCPC